MPTTTFCDVKMTEDLENYRYEKTEYNLSEGDVVSIPYHTARKFINGWDYADYESEPYEVKQEDYDSVLMKVKGAETCEAEKSDGEVCGREKPCPYHDEE